MSGFGDTTYANLLTARHGAVALVALNRPGAKNALNEAVRADLREAFAAAERDAAVRAIVVAGEGTSFCAGADIRELQARTVLGATWAPDRIDVAIESATKPVVGALHGYTFGGGLELALAFTIRIAADTLKCGLPEIKLGVFPGLGGTQRLPRIVGEGRALEIILTGRTIDAQEALAIGLVTRVVPEGELRAEALALAKRLADGPPIATRIVVEAVRRASDMGRAEGLDYERRLFGVVCATEDKQEGIAAWLEKRTPTFGGR